MDFGWRRATDEIPCSLLGLCCYEIQKSCCNTGHQMERTVAYDLAILLLVNSAEELCPVSSYADDIATLCLCVFHANDVNASPALHCGRSAATFVCLRTDVFMPVYGVSCFEERTSRIRLLCIINKSLCSSSSETRSHCRIIERLQFYRWFDASFQFLLDIRNKWP